MPVSLHFWKRFFPRVRRLPWQSVVPIDSDGPAVVIRRSFGGFFATVRRRMGGITVSFGFDDDDFCNGRNCRHCRELYELTLASRLAEAHARYNELRRLYNDIRRQIIQICVITQGLSKATPTTLTELECLVDRAAFMAGVILEECGNMGDFDDGTSQDNVSEVEFEARSFASL